MELNAKAWITHNGEMVFSRGRAELLEAIDATGSISAAARRLDMSYRHAWSMIRASEDHLGRPLLDRTKGGAKGGGASLTDAARALLEAYRAIENNLSDFVREERKTLATERMDP